MLVGVKLAKRRLSIAMAGPDGIRDGKIEIVRVVCA